MSVFQYPLSLRFKLVALAPRIYLTDSSGTERLYIHQKVLKLKEDVRVYNNSKKEQEIFRIRADRIIDFSANYRFINSTNEQSLGSIKRKGMRSLWRATYFSDDMNGQTSHHLKEDNPWTKVLDGFFTEIPIVGLFSGYVFNPAYTVYRGNDRKDESQPVMKLKKQPAFWESKYVIENTQPSMSSNEEIQVLLAIIMMLQLERWRG